MVPQENESDTRGMAASIITDSTPDCHKVLVHSEVKGQEGNYVVDINKVDPSDATQIEIFAFMEYQDSIGNGVGDTFGSYHTLKSMLNEGKHYRETTPEIDNADLLLSIKRNWLSLLTDKVNEYSDITEPSVALLTRRAKSLQKLMEDWVKNR